MREYLGAMLNPKASARFAERRSCIVVASKACAVAAAAAAAVLMNGVDDLGGPRGWMESAWRLATIAGFTLLIQSAAGRLPGCCCSPLATASLRVRRTSPSAARRGILLRFA